MIDNDTLERLINANREIHSVVNIVPDDQPNLQPTIELTYPQAAKALLQFAIPLLFRSGTFAAYESLKALIVSQDKTLLPAYADIRITEIVLQCFLSGIVYSIPPIIREAKHANETLKIGIIFRQGIIYSALAGMIISAGAVIIIPKMLEVADQPGVVTQNSQAYFAYSALGYFLEAIYRSEIRFIMGGFGIKKTALITDFFDVMLDLALTDAFMFGRFGFPEMRLPGAALAFTVSKLIALVVHTLFIYAHTIFFGAILKPYALFDRKALLDLAILKTIAKKGIPLGVDYSANLAAFMTITYFCGIRGTAGLVAIQVASLYAGTIKAAAGTLFTASNSLVGKHALNTGSRNAVTIGNAGIFLSTGVAVAGLMVVLFSPEFIARILISESEPSEHNNFEMAIKLLRIEGVLQIGTAIRVSITAYLSGIQDNFFPMMVTIICNLLINVTSAAVAKFALDKDESVIYGSQAVGFTIAAIMMLSRLMQKSSAYQYNDAVMPAAPIANHSSRCVNPYHFLRSCFSKNNTAPGEKTRLIRSDSVDSVASLATLNP